jgi:hypothetical protein
MSCPFEFEPLPFSEWRGPYKPGRGTMTGLRVRWESIGAWFNGTWWPLVPTTGTRKLVQLVQSRWGGGRILLLPWGDVVKAPQGTPPSHIGRWRGSVAFMTPYGHFDIKERAIRLSPGDLWEAPHHIGLECIITERGGIFCEWDLLVPRGTETVRKELWRPNRDLAQGFREARPCDTRGRVHVLPGGVVVTVASSVDGWETRFVGMVDTEDALLADW